MGKGVKIGLAVVLIAIAAALIVYNVVGSGSRPGMPVEGTGIEATSETPQPVGGSMMSEGFEDTGN